MRAGVVILAAVATLMPVAGFSQAASRGTAMKPDFSHIDSQEAAEALAAQGKLVKILLFPAELGGPDDPENIAYITPEAAEARLLIIGTLRRFADEGLIDNMSVRPEYKGKSIVPSRLVMEASSSKKPGGFNPTIEVW
jgi:hypothetical protein